MDSICKADFEKREKAHNAAVKAVEDAKKKGLSTNGIIIQENGCHEIYGVWFFGKLKEIVQQIGTERFGVDIGKMMPILSMCEPKKIDNRVYNIAVYGHQCKLYKWMAQGYYRGLVVLMHGEVETRSAESTCRVGRGCGC